MSKRRLCFDIGKYVLAIASLLSVIAVPSVAQQDSESMPHTGTQQWSSNHRNDEGQRDEDVRELFERYRQAFENGKLYQVEQLVVWSPLQRNAFDTFLKDAHGLEVRFTILAINGNGDEVLVEFNEELAFERNGEVFHHTIGKVKKVKRTEEGWKLLLKP